MNLVDLRAGAFGGGVPGAATWLGLRPEDVMLEGPVDALVRSVEYLGADAVLRCAVGGNDAATLTVRAPGQSTVVAGTRVRLGWAPEAQHFFSADGARID